MKITDTDLSQAQRERFLELRALFAGELQRGDVDSSFGIKPAVTSC